MEKIDFSSFFQENLETNYLETIFFYSFLFNPFLYGSFTVGLPQTNQPTWQDQLTGNSHKCWKNKEDVVKPILKLRQGYKAPKVGLLDKLVGEVVQQRQKLVNTWIPIISFTT